MTTNMSTSALNELNSRRENDGKFGTKNQSDPTVSIDTTAGPAHDLHAMEEARDAQMEIWADAMDKDAESDEFAALDAKHQQASLECASAAVLAKYPEAATLVLKENEDGERQYDLDKVLDADGNVLDTSENDDFAHEMGYGQSSFVNETLWALNPEDDAWAAGKADITTKMGTKFASINLRASLPSA